MVVSIQFYRAQMCYGLKNSLETQEFTLKMNNMFDAMNRKFPAEAVRKNNKDFEVYICVVCFSLCHLCNCVVLGVYRYSIINCIILIFNPT